EVDARADIYAVGALAYFLVAGSPPFDGDTAMEVMTHHVRDQPEPLSVRSRRTAPAALEALVHACLAKEPADRPATMGELRAALTALPIERWSEAAAATWWRERAGAVAGRGQGAPAERSPATVAVDLGRRQGAASALEPTQLQHTGVR
ncbi:MAG TPA: hypothetical protein VKB80_24015, partial [Kofleriaceae bacterium]|nr:hypothetical protein [Kofleriaceae bacterium]